MTDSDEWAERWTPLPAPYSKYEVFSDGREADQRPVRKAGGKPLALTLSNSGYLLVKVYDDNGKRQTKTVHSLVLLGFAGECPPGMETRHLDDDPLNNRWRPGSTDDEVRAAGGNLIWGTKKQQHADKVANGGATEAPKTFPCVNHARCGGMVTNPGRRCLDCVAEVGREAAALLNGGRGLQAVAEHFGYTGPDWVFKLAVQHGGYEGTRMQARMQGVVSVHHEPCRCAECQPPANTQRERGWFARTLATLRVRRPGGSR